MCMTTSDHRHPGARKQKFPLIVGPPFIHATNPAKARGIFDISIVAQLGLSRHNDAPRMR